MGIFDIFSKRQKRLRGETPDVYQYDSIPQELRVQIVHILKDALGDPKAFNSQTFELIRFIHDTLCREYGQFSLVNNQPHNNAAIYEAVVDFLLKEKDVERVLDVVELSFRTIDRVCREYRFQRYSNPEITPDEAIEELNQRFKEHGVGFEYQSGEMIRIDSKVLHKEAVKPTLKLLQDKRYSGANEEFLSAHEHYRHKRYKECLNDCLKALESTIKTICEIRGWQYSKKDTASNLISICFKNDLVPSFLQSHFSSLRANLESGVPTIRNKLGGHGQGSKQKSVPSYFAAYQLHMTASLILFLIQAEQN